MCFGEQGSLIYLLSVWCFSPSHPHHIYKSKFHLSASHAKQVLASEDEWLSKIEPDEYKRFKL